jgi:hypothetical protein
MSAEWTTERSEDFELRSEKEFLSRSKNFLPATTYLTHQAREALSLWERVGGEGLAADENQDYK